MANLCRDQQAAELGDHKRGLGSDDLPAIQQVRVPCLLNSAACHLKLGNVSGAQAGEGGSLSTALTTALRCCAEVLQAGPPAAQRAKAYFRMGQVSATPCRGLPWLGHGTDCRRSSHAWQAHVGLGNPREAWAALVQAQEINPSSREVRELLIKVSYELKQLKVAAECPRDAPECP